jgi:hypothetical protein
MIERKFSMAELEWAGKVARESKAGKAREAEEDAELQEEWRVVRESDCGLWSEVGEVFT